MLCRGELLTSMPCRQPKQPTQDSASFQSPLSRLVGGWRLYLQQRVLPAAFALALLYLTVLSLGLLMTAYLKWLVGGHPHCIGLVHASLSKPSRDVQSGHLLCGTACAHVAQCGPGLRGLEHLNSPSSVNW